jgi:uracil-DNA glycosylase
MPRDAFSAFDSDPLDQPASAIIDLSSKVVPNQHPTIPPSTFRLAIIGSHPTEDDISIGKPFSGMAGRLLDQLLSKHGIPRMQCLVANLTQSPDSTDHAQLSLDLAQFKPNLCLLLGSEPFKAAHGYGSIFDWRGSLFIGKQDSPFANLKCLGILDPSFVLRQWDGFPLLSLDLRRAKHQSTFPDLRLPLRQLYATLPYTNTIVALDQIVNSRAPVSCDIEGGVRDVSCIGFATSKATGFVVPFTLLNGDSYWPIDQEAELWRRVAFILASPHIKKVWQNGLYDRFVLQWAHNLVIRNSADDTMIKHWSLYCEMEKSLGFQCSIYTDEPFYKFERKTEDQETYYKYCAKDAAVTYEINQTLDGCLTPPQKEHYQFNLVALNVLLYMELRGIKYDQEEANKRLAEMQDHVYTQQALLDQEASKVGALPDPVDFGSGVPAIIARIQQSCCYKKDQTIPKKDYAEDYFSILKKLQETTELTPQLKGEISALVGASMNTKGPGFKDFLYKHLGLPVQYKKDLKTKEMRPTTDYNALLHLAKDSDHPALQAALELSRFRTRAQMLAIRSYKGRMHCSYNLVGSETGRVTSSKSMIYVGGKNRVGANMQTVPDDWEIFDENHPVRQGMRDLLVADPGCYLAKADLKGADGWTIGAYMAMLGDRTMLDDLLYGIKPAQVVAYILIHGADAYHKVANNRAALAEAVQCVKKDMWQYFVSKIGIWGTFYTMGPVSLARNVFIQSEGAVVLSSAQSKTFQQCILVRYRARLWQDWMQNYLAKQPYPAQLVAPNGHIRKFFGRKTEVLGQALAHLPQVVTTYATLLAANKLWTDLENRTTDPCLSPAGLALINRGTTPVAGRTYLRIEPLHQVHDELLMQFRIEDTAWATAKIKSYFNNPMIVANQKLTIPYDGAYGTAWSMDSTHKKGTL